MKTGIADVTEHKEVVIIGNGPSGIVLSYMLAGNLPFVISDQHPDEMLSARLRPVVGKCLLEEDLEFLSAGLEGRSTNPVSLLMDALLRPYADIGLELEPLVEFRKAGVEIDHIVLGKGPPGGSWHKMDPQVLTLSLGSWMALPGLPFHCRDSGEKRAYAHTVAKYYEEYVYQMHLKKYFRTNVLVTSVEPLIKNTRIPCSEHADREKCKIKRNSWVKNINNDNAGRVRVCIEPENEGNMEKRSCFLSNAINCLLSKSSRKSRCCKRPNRDPISENSPTRKIREIGKGEKPEPKTTKRDKIRSQSFGCKSYNSCDSFQNKSFNEKLNSVSLDLSKSVPFTNKCNCCEVDRNWIVESVDTETGEKVVYSCKYLVLACGASDIPNKLEIFSKKKDISWLVHDLTTLEDKLDFTTKDTRPEELDPVLIVGGGLSAADAIIATRARNIPVVHVFRNRSDGLNKQLPENMYPEYHKVHHMMKDGGATYPLYMPYAEYSLTKIDEDSHTVILTSKSGEQAKLHVSFVAVLIGSRPDLSFLPKDTKVGVKKNCAIDCKTNAIDINKLTHEVNGYHNLFAIGPLASDNFIRFIPGGAFAVVSEFYKRNGYS